MVALPESDTSRFFVWELLHPRTVIGAFKLQGPSLSRALWVVAIATIVSIAMTAWESAELQKLSASYETISGSPLADGFIFGSLEAVLYPILVFLWSYLFGFRNDQAGVRAAIDTSYAYSAITLLITTPLNLSLLRLGISGQYVDWMFVPATAISLCIYVVCFKAALDISWMRSVLVNVAVVMIVLAGGLLALLGWFIVDAIMTVYAS